MLSRITPILGGELRVAHDRLGQRHGVVEVTSPRRPTDERHRSSSSAVPLLDVEGVSKGFPGVLALDDVRLDLRHGEVLALVGENGAGKSTLMKLLAGIYTPDAGSFRLNGEELTIEGPRHAQELGISIIHQELNLMPDLTVAQNIFIGREQRSAGLFLDDRALNRRARELFDRLGLALDPAERVGHLTVARQQMVEIAKALTFNARVLIMDEPTAALNDAEVDVCSGSSGGSAAPTPASSTSRTAWTSSHASRDRVTVLRDGRYIDTMVTAQTDPEGDHRADGRSAARGRTAPGAADGIRGARAVGRGAVDEAPPARRQLRGARRRDPRVRRAHGRRAHRGRAGDRRRRPDGTGEVSGARRDGVDREPRRGGARHGIGYLSEDRKQLGVLLGRSVRENVVLSSLRDYVVGARLRQRCPHRGDRP